MGTAVFPRRNFKRSRDHSDRSVLLGHKHSVIMVSAGEAHGTIRLNITPEYSVANFDNLSLRFCIAVCVVLARSAWLCFACKSSPQQGIQWRRCATTCSTGRVDVKLNNMACQGIKDNSCDCQSDCARLFPVRGGYLQLLGSHEKRPDEERTGAVIIELFIAGWIGTRRNVWRSQEAGAFGYDAGNGLIHERPTDRQQRGDEHGMDQNKSARAGDEFRDELGAWRVRGRARS